MNGLLLSRVQVSLHPTGSARTRGATRGYLLHQLVADLFGQYEKRPFLYRSDGSDGPRTTAIVLSSKAPIDASDHRGSPAGSILKVESKPFELSVPVGTLLDFEIRINATKDVRQDNGSTRRTDIWEAERERTSEPGAMADVYAAYLGRKLTGSAKVLVARVIARQFPKVRAGLKRRPITFVATDLIGSLEVQDARKLSDTMSNGIGRSKAFGCGLLCLSRPGAILPRRHPEHF